MDRNQCRPGRFTAVSSLNGHRTRNPPSGTRPSLRTFRRPDSGEREKKERCARDRSIIARDVTSNLGRAVITIAIYVTTEELSERARPRLYLLPFSLMYEKKYLPLVYHILISSHFEVSLIYASKMYISSMGFICYLSIAVM